MNTLKFTIYLFVALFVANTSLLAGNINRSKHTTSKCNSQIIEVCKDTIMGKAEYTKLQTEINCLKTERESLKTQLANLRIATMLEIQDTTIFGSRFIHREQFTQPIPILYSDYYDLIEHIRNLNFLLDIKGNDLVQMVNILEKNIPQAREKIKIINLYASADKRKVLDFLSPEQMLFLKNLTNRYNDYIKSFNFTTHE